MKEIKDKIKLIIANSHTLGHAADEILMLFPQWIPVSERLPEIPEGKHWVTCLVCQEGHVYIADYIGLLGDKPRWEDCGSAGMYGVTHWQNLPELPEGK